MRQFLNEFGRPAAGLLLCAGLALAVALFAAPRPWRGIVPLAFAVVIILLAARYGRPVALFGSVAAALIFAWVLYQPLGSIRVDDHTEKSSLAWMLLSSITLSYLLLPGKPGRGDHSNQQR
jgi:K+-sensing histidine kinase KdpD